MMSLIKADFCIKPDWPVAENVFACSTTRHGGFSLAPYDHLNLANHVGDDDNTVLKNRAYLRKTLQLAQEPAWLQQTHSIKAVELTDAKPITVPADASFSRQPGQVSVVLTADCLPLLICDRAGGVVAAIHAGWRGLVAGIVEQTLQLMKIASQDVLVWLGPAISATHFEVGAEVREAFVSQHKTTAAAFERNAADKYLADLYEIARIRLRAIGVNAVYGGNYCTYADAAKFFSYRRDQNTGRIASLITLVKK